MLGSILSFWDWLISVGTPDDRNQLNAQNLHFITEAGILLQAKIASYG